MIARYEGILLILGRAANNIIRSKRAIIATRKRLVTLRKERHKIR